MLLPDYLLAAWVAPVLRGLRLDFRHLRPEDVADCRRLGRGEEIDDDGLERALGVANHVWYVVFAGSLGLAIAFMLLVGAVAGHRALGGPVPPRVFGVLLGLAALGGFEFAFTMSRARVMVYGRLGPQGPARVQAWASMAAYPKLRDFVISLVAGVLIAIAATQTLLDPVPPA
jgi:hypothetical protein